MTEDWHHQFYENTYVHRITAAVMIVDNKDHLMLIQEGREINGTVIEVYSISGGTLEKGETIIQGAIRETKEETSLDIKLFGMVGVINWKRVEGKPKYPTDPYTHQGFDFVLVGRLVSPKEEFVGQEGERIQNYAFVDLKEFDVIIKNQPRNDWLPENGLTHLKTMYKRYLDGNFLRLEDDSGLNNYSIRHTYL